MELRSVAADEFSRFAAGDLVRWRALRGCAVVPRDGRWGEGRVTDVRWEGRTDLPDDRGTVYLRIEYADDLRVNVNARAFAEHHSGVQIDAELASFVRQWFSDPDVLDDGERIAAVAERVAALRVKQDAERLARVEELRRLARERRARTN